MTLSACGSGSSSSSSASPSGGAAVSSSTHTSTGTTTTTSTSAAATGADTKSAAGSYHGPSSSRRLVSVRGRRATPALVARFGRQHRAAAQAHVNGLAGLPLISKIGVAANNVAGNWAQLFAKAGGSLPAATVNLIGNQPASCGSASIGAGASPEYCPATDTIEIPLGFMSARVAPLGDSALLLLISDLYGYHVENALGLLGPGRGGGQLQRIDSCFSGVYFLSVYGALQRTDEDGINRLLALSAPVAGRGGTVTSGELTNAFNVGLVVSNGNYRACLGSGV